MPSRRELRILAPISRRKFLGMGLAGSLLAAAGCSTSNAGQRLNFYNYSNYIAPTTLPDFEKDFGVRVTYDNYTAQDTLEAKLRIGSFGYDLIVASDYKVTRFKKAGLIQPLNQRRLTQLDNLFDWVRDNPYDPGNAYSVPWQWGTTGVGFNRQYVKKDIRSWRALWDADFSGRIDMLNERRECVGIALMVLGYSVNTIDDRQLDQAKWELLRQRALLKHYSSDTYIDEMASEDAWLCGGWSGDVFQAMADNPQIGYVIPHEGSIVWMDNMCIPAGAPHKEIAESFINYVLTPQVHAAISNAVEYATPNRAALPFIRKDLRDNPLVYPPADMMRKFEFLRDLGAAETKYNRVWEQVRLQQV